jgi:hypothetical protein
VSCAAAEEEEETEEEEEEDDLDEANSAGVLLRELELAFGNATSLAATAAVDQKRRRNAAWLARLKAVTATGDDDAININKNMAILETECGQCSSSSIIGRERIKG